VLSPRGLCDVVNLSCLEMVREGRAFMNDELGNHYWQSLLAKDSRKGQNLATSEKLELRLMTCEYASDRVITAAICYLPT
jgi:hypothetical protein